MEKSISKDLNARMNQYINENYDRLHVIVPPGTKNLLRGRFQNGMTLNKYINVLIDLDLQGKVDWRGYDANFGLLRQMAAAEKA